MNELNMLVRYKKVMVIDDTAVDRYIAERQIEKNGFANEVISKESVDTALEYLASLSAVPEELPQLIFLDIQMPEKNGFDFLEEYEKLSESIKMKCIIIMLSTSLNSDDHERATRNKYVRKFIDKPLNADALNELFAEFDQQGEAA